MPDIIQLLPDSVANQIAAGEVIQRPASVVKELVENSIDSGATSITVLLKDAGKTSIQIVDNGCGMSETDARMSFERHATSKIRAANDLFSIRTKGFRGEALASVAAIAELTLKTKRHEDDLGVQIKISGSEVHSQEPVNCPDGSNFIIKNLFYNVPARRKFLKANSTELKLALVEFQRLAIAHPEIDFAFLHNNLEVYNLPKTNLRNRVVKTIGKHANQNLIDIKTDTSIVKISGFLGKPEYAKKSPGEQYFFVNKRFIRHPYLHKAVVKAYEKIIPADHIPSYYVFFDINPENIDINIHPTKTEVKFEDEKAVWQILNAAVRESLGKFNIMPSIDFDVERSFDIPVLTSKTEINIPETTINPDYNPFKTEKRYAGTSYSLNKEKQLDWEKIYKGFENEKENSDNTTSVQINFPERNADEENGNMAQNFMQLKNKYILTPVKSGLMVIDQKRAHQRILYENYLNTLEHRKGNAQQDLFPESFELDPGDYILMRDIMDDVNFLGFDIRDFGNNSIVVYGYPADLENTDIKELLLDFLSDYKQCDADVKISAKDKLARSFAMASSVKYGKSLSGKEMREIVDKLFGCSDPGYSPNGKPVLSIIPMDELENKFG